MLRARGMSCAGLRGRACGLRHAQADAGVKVLVFHGPADATTDGRRRRARGAGRRQRLRGRRDRRAAQLSAANLANYRAVVFLNTAGDLPHAAQEAARQAFVQGGGGFLAIGTAAQGEPGLDLRPAARRAPRRDSPTAVSRADRRGRRPGPPRDARPPADLRTAPTSGTRGRPARPAASTRSPATTRRRRPATARTSAAPTTRSPGAATSSGGRTFYTGMGRTAAGLRRGSSATHLGRPPVDEPASARRLQGHDQRQLPRSGRHAGPTTTGLHVQRRVARPRHRAERLDSLHRPRRLPHGRRARRAARPERARRSSTTSTRTSASAAARPRLRPAKRRRDAQQRHHPRRHARRLRRRRHGEERTNQDNHKMEYGLLGVVAAPDFTKTGHIYVQYFPSFNPSAQPPGLPARAPDLEDVAPAHLALHDSTRDEAARPGLRGQDLRLRRPGLLLLPRRRRHGVRLAGQPVRDDRRHELVAGHRRLLGQQPGRQVPDRPEHAPSAALRHGDFSYQDARRTAGNTNDYNGKMLRLNPIDDHRRRGAAGGRGRHDLHAARRGSPNGPNLFDGTEGNGNQARPEIYAMGLRNPCGWRSTRDRRPVHRVGRPGRRRPSATLGPSTYESVSQIDRAGNYGWPYCMGNGQAYRDRVADGTPQRTTARPATCRAARPPAAPRAGTTATTSATTRRTTRVWSSCRTTPAPGWTPARCGATTSGGAAATRAPPTAARRSRVTAARTTRPTTAPTPTRAVPVRPAAA